VQNGTRIFGRGGAPAACALIGLVLTGSPAWASDPAGPQAESPPTPTEAERFEKTVERSALRERAISMLLELSASIEPQVRANALEALSPARSRLPGPVAAGLIDENEGVRAVAALVAGKARLGGLEASLRPLLTDRSAFVKGSAIFALRSIGAEVDPTLLGSLLLEHPEPRVRAHAAFVLGELGEASALPMLRQALHAKVPMAAPEEERLLSLQIAEAMVKLGDRDRVEGIRAALYPAFPEELERATLAVQILGRLQDRSSVTQLINLAEYKQGNRGMPGEIRLAVADAVARMGRREGWFIAESYVNDADPLRRALAAQVLGQTRRPQDLATLDRLLGDANPAVRVAAAGAVLEATGPGGG
jgi:HEAT repeat protein